jgi:hypothetical protein
MTVCAPVKDVFCTAAHGPEEFESFRQILILTSCLLTAPKVAVPPTIIGGGTRLAGQVSSEQERVGECRT